MYINTKTILTFPSNQANIPCKLQSKYSIIVRREKGATEIPAEALLSPGVHSNRTSTPTAPFRCTLRVVYEVDSTEPPPAAASRYGSARVDRWKGVRRTYKFESLSFEFWEHHDIFLGFSVALFCRGRSGSGIHHSPLARRRIAPVAPVV